MATATKKKVTDDKARKARVKALEMQKESEGVSRKDVVNMLKKTGDEQFQKEYLHIFDELKRNIRVFERNMKMNPSSRNVYALMALYTQQREVIADIRAMTDYTEHANVILNDVIQPLFNSITQSNLDVFFHIRKLILEVVDDKKTQYTLKRLEDLMREQARYLQERYSHTQSEIIKAVVSK